jgi:hypothetical protein
MAVSKRDSKYNYYMSQQYLFWDYAPKKQNHHLIKIICTPVFIVTLITIAKNRNKLRVYQWKLKWLQKLWYAYTGGIFL